jgi:hypothetical protein
MSLTVDETGEVIEPPKPRGRPRTHFTRGEDREFVLRYALARIAEAQPPELNQIIERAESMRRLALMQGDRVLAADAEMIETRATRRLAALKRQEATG